MSGRSLGAAKGWFEPQRPFAPEVEKTVERAYMRPTAQPLLCLFVGLVL